MPPCPEWTYTNKAWTVLRAPALKGDIGPKDELEMRGFVAWRQGDGYLSFYKNHGDIPYPYCVLMQPPSGEEIVWFLSLPDYADWTNLYKTI